MTGHLRKSFSSQSGTTYPIGSSTRTSLTAFETGAGDVLVTYEQDSLFARGRGVPLEIVMPRQTTAAENAAVIVDKNVNQKERPAAEAFMEYLLSDEALGIFNRYYLRPVTQLQHRSSVPPQFFTVEELGGWSTAYTESLESLWQAKIAPGLEPDQ